MPIVFLLLWFFAGLALGSFLNALEWRLRHRISLLDTRSKCPVCAKRLRWFHLVPVVSFLLLRGHCAFCKQKISWQYPLVELWLGVVFVFLLRINGGVTQIFLWQSAAVIVLTLICIYDAKYQEIPDNISVPAIVFFLVYALVTRTPGLPSLGLGVAAGGGIFLLQYLVSTGRWVGGGDVRLGVLMGVLLGWPNILAALFLAYMVGAIFGVFLVIRKKKTMKSEVAFGTFLSAATLFTMVWGDTMIQWYLLFLR